MFPAGAAASIDLSSTLPVGIVRGGVFLVDPSGASLPVGMSFTSAGILSIGNAASGSVAGVVISYTEPGS